MSEVVIGMAALRTKRPNNQDCLFKVHICSSGLRRIANLDYVSIRVIKSKYALTPVFLSYVVYQFYMRR